MADTATRAAERAARDSYGRLVAILAARCRDVAAAEDALAEAFRTALETWPARGVPERPEAWLLVAARRALGHGRRHEAVRAAAAGTLALLQDEAASMEAGTMPDERLKLLFVCAHPAIDPALQAPLMLQCVLGLDAQRIAACFLTAPATMSQRLVRAKARLKAEGVPFEVPDPAEWAARLGPVLDAIYATYGTGWEDVLGADPRRKGLAEEAIWLGRLLCGLLPREPEAKGLLALMLYCESRREARRDAAGGFVPLARQDVSRWDRDAAGEAEALLRDASVHGRLGRYQVEAAIQSVHLQRAVTGERNDAALLTLYGWLASLSPTVGVLAARAAAHLDAGDPDAALAALDAIGPAADTYQPAWAVRAAAQAARGDREAALLSYDRAAGLTEDAAVRDHLLARAAALLQS